MPQRRTWIALLLATCGFGFTILLKKSRHVGTWPHQAYGFDSTMFTCIDLTTGKRQWKRGRYGKGQVLLLADSAVLLVLSERGEVVLLKADPSGHQELAKLSAIEGRTWNHPVVVGNRPYVRNSREAVCYRLPLVGN